MTYMLRYRVTATGTVNEATFDSMLARALFIISWSARIDVLKEWS